MLELPSRGKQPEVRVSGHHVGWCLTPPCVASAQHDTRRTCVSGRNSQVTFVHSAVLLGLETRKGWPTEGKSSVGFQEKKRASIVKLDTMDKLGTGS